MSCARAVAAEWLASKSMLLFAGKCCKRCDTLYFAHSASTFVTGHGASHLLSFSSPLSNVWHCHWAIRPVVMEVALARQGSHPVMEHNTIREDRAQNGTEVGVTKQKQGAAQPFLRGDNAHVSHAYVAPHHLRKCGSTRQNVNARLTELSESSNLGTGEYVLREGALSLDCRRQR